MDAAVFQLLHLSNELDDSAPGIRIAHILLRNGRNALGMDPVGVHMGAIGQRGQDADFPAGIDTLHIGGGVPLGVTQLLGQLQGILKGHVLPDHFGEDKIGGAV